MKKNHTLIELLVGIILLGIVAQIFCAFISKDYFYYGIGLWGGVAVACFMAVHMQRSIEDELELGEEGAVSHARSAYATRLVVSLVVIGIIVWFKLGNPITLVIGIMTLKISAYLQPQTHKLFVKWEERKKGGLKNDGHNGGRR